jgi:hypothetical protein
MARIVINKKAYNLGCYLVEEDASEAYKTALYNWNNKKELPNYINLEKASKYESIYYVKGKKKPWKASIKVADKIEYIGYYYTEEEAREAQLKKLQPNS